MKTSPWLSASPYATALLAMGLLQSGAGAQPAERDPIPLVTAPTVQDVSPVGDKGSPLTPVAEIAPIVVNASAYKVEVAIKKLRKGEITPEQAWDSKALNVDDLIYFLEKGLDSWGGFFWEKDPELRRALVSLLVEHGGEKLRRPDELAPTVRLWLADYYGNIEDERVLSLSESILKEMKPMKGENALAFQALERMAWFYRSKGQYEKAAQTWLHMKTYHLENGWWQPDALLEAARLYNQAGNQAKAKELYAEIPKSGDGWGTGMALWDQAESLIVQGKHKEARKLLSVPIVGPRSDDIQVVMSAELAYSYYLTQETAAAYKTAQRSLELIAKVPNPSAGTREFAERAQNILSWLEVWKQEPIICLPRKLRLGTEGEESGTGHISVRTFGDTPLTITTNNKKIQLQLQKGGSWSEFHFERAVMVRIAPNVPPIDMEAVLTIRSPKHPNFVVHVPIHVEKSEEK